MSWVLSFQTLRFEISLFLDYRGIRSTIDDTVYIISALTWIC